LFSDRLSPDVLSELEKSFRGVTASSSPMPPAVLPEVMLVAPEHLEETLTRQSTQTTGFSGFTRPVYARGGYALVYASYTCGGLCGLGWFFLLDHPAGSWHVVAVEGLWIS